MTISYLLRHGQTTLSKAYVVSGDPTIPAPLDPVGIAQSRRVTAAPWVMHIRHCVTSEFGRTQETARIILGDSEIVPISVDARLNEIRYGKFEAEPWMTYGHWLKSAGMSSAPPDGESRNAAISRMLTGLEAALAALGPRLIVGHGLMISAVLQLLRHQPLDVWELPRAAHVRPIPLADEHLRSLVVLGRTQLAQVNEREPTRD